MVREKRGFTLPELLTVIAVIAILAAITFPVMRGVRASAMRATCASNFHQAQLATTLYLGDYDDHFMLVNYNGPEARPTEKDRTWVQVILPYLATFDIFRCPADVRHRLRSDASFDIDLVPGDTYSRYYRASLLSNIGYNYLYLSPVYKVGDHWLVQPRTVSAINDPASMLLFVDSVNERSKSNNPPGGGSYIVAPPCRYGTGATDSFGIVENSVLWTPTKGWRINSSGQSLDRFGRAWPWHTGRANVARVAGGTKAMTMEQLAAGCQVRDSWTGRIQDPGRYDWDLQ